MKDEEFAKAMAAPPPQPPPLPPQGNSQNYTGNVEQPTSFICKLEFRPDDLPDPSSQPKLLSIRKSRDKHRAARYAVTSLEKVHKPQLHVDPDLGMPLDLLDLSVYNAPKNERVYVDPEDEILLQEDVTLTPIKNEGLKRKERPTDKGMSWLVKTQYISPITADATRQSTEKQAKELRERRYNALLDNSREKKIKDIRASFEACKKRPVHETNKKLRPVEILPLFPDFDRLEDQFVVATFDGPTLDSESYNKMEKSVRDAHESQAIMKSFVSSSSDTAKPDKFLAYMVPSVGELSKDIYDESEDISYTWVREYHWDVRGEDVNDPTNFLVSFGESEARYMPLPTKLMLRKKRARDRKASGEVEHFPVPAHITVRQRSRVPVDMKEPELQHENTRPEEGGITLKQAFAVFELAYDQLEKDYEKEKLRADNERICKEKESVVRVSLENEISFLNSKILSLTQKVSSVQEHPSAELKLLQGRVSEKENELKLLQEEKERVNHACACSKSEKNKVDQELIKLKADLLKVKTEREQLKNDLLNEIKKVEEQKMITEMNTKHALEEKERADMFKQQAMSEKARADKLANDLEDTKKRGKKASVELTNMKLLKRKLKLEKERVKHAGKEAELERERVKLADKEAELEKKCKEMAEEELHQLKLEFARILSRMGLCNSFSVGEGTRLSIETIEKNGELGVRTVEDNVRSPLTGRNTDANSKKRKRLVKNEVDTGNTIIALIPSAGSHDQDSVAVTGNLESKTLSGNESGPAYDDSTHYIVVFPEIEDRDSLSKIVDTTKMFTTQCYEVSQIEVIFKDVVCALSTNEVLSPKEKICAFFSLFLKSFSTIASTKFSNLNDKNFLNSIDVFSGQLKRVISDEEIRAMFTKVCDLDELLTLTKKFIIDGRVLHPFDIASETLPSPDSKASLHQLVLGALLLASVCAVFDRIEVIIETSYIISSRNGSSTLIFLHMFANVCGETLLAHGDYNLIMTVVTSLVAYLEKEKLSPSFHECGKCRFSDGPVSMEEVAGLLLKQLSGCCMNNLGMATYKSDIDLEGVVSLFVLVASKMSWDWVCKNIVRGLLELSEVCVVETSLMAINVLLGEMARLGIDANGFQDAEVENIIVKLNSFISESTSSKTSLSVQFAAVNGLLVSTSTGTDCIEKWFSLLSDENKQSIRSHLGSFTADVS